MGKRIKQLAPGCAARSRLMWSWDPGPKAVPLSISLVHPALPGLCRACQAQAQIVLSDLLISLVAGMTAMQRTNAGDYHRDSRQNKERGTRRKQGIRLRASTKRRKAKGGCLILKIATWALSWCFWAASRPEEHREAAAPPQLPSSVVASGDVQPGAGRQLAQSPSLAERRSLSFAFPLCLQNSSRNW